MPWEPETEFALKLAKLAREAILPRFGKPLQVESKADSSPVTEADREAERAMRAAIERAYPEDGLIGEEFGESNGKSGRQWVLDPIDGTKSFIHGVPLFGTLVGLLDGEEPVVGVISLPALDSVMWAARGGGCLLDGSPCRASEIERLEAATLLDGSVTSMENHGLAQAWGGLRRKAGLHRGWGDCYGYYLVAAGRAEAMLDPVASVWDLVAPAVILREAGGRFTDLKGEDGVFGGNGLGTNGRLHGEILQALAGAEGG